MPFTRPHLKPSTYGNITQGTVFSCGYAARYEDRTVYGLTITARCDVAQQKYPVLNYVPIVTLSDWLRRDGLDIIIEQEENDLSGRIKAILRQSNISSEILLSIPLEEIAKTHFPTDTKDKRHSKINSNFSEISKKLITVRELKNKENPNIIYQWFVNNSESRIRDIITRLSQHSVLGHYLLETLSHRGDEKYGYVCLLREVTTLPRVISEKIGKGLDKKTHDDLCKKYMYSNRLIINQDELSMPVVEIGSPTIEHILQCFSNLFGRIGISDPIDETILNLVSYCMSEKEARS